MAILVLLYSTHTIADLAVMGLIGIAFALVTLDFGHFPCNPIAGKWQPDEGLIARVWEAN
jgi:hypothetical protein